MRWFDLSMRLDVVLDSKVPVQIYGGYPVLGVLNVNSLSLKSILNLIGSQ